MSEEYNMELSLLKFKKTLKAHTFREYCRVADALVDIHNLKGEKADQCYGVLYYPDKMVAKYGSNYFRDFLDYVDNGKRTDHVMNLLRSIVITYIRGIQEKRDPVIKSIKSFEMFKGKPVKSKITITDVNGNLVHIAEDKDGHIIMEKEGDK